MDNKLFIEAVKECAKNTMREYKLLASVQIAQAIIYTGYGESELYKEANNCFDTKGEYNGQYHEIKVNAEDDKTNTVDTIKYKKYESLQESFNDNAKLLFSAKNGKNYRYRNLMNVTDYTKACELLQKDKYSTDNKYAEKLINLIESEKLNEIDEEVLTKPLIAKTEEILKSNPTKIIVEVDGPRMVDHQISAENRRILTTEEKETILKKANTYNPRISKTVIMAGTELNLKDTPLYASSSAKTKTKNVTGKYFLYDGILFGTRYRITNNKKNVRSNKDYIIGYIDKSNIK